MSKLYKKLFALVCAAALLAGCMGLTALADSGEADGAAEAEPVVLTCSEIPLYIDDVYIGTGILLDSVTYVPLLAFIEYMLQDTCDVEWDQETGTAMIEAEELELSLTTTENFMSVNGRYLYFEDGVYNINGTIVVPLRELAKIFGLTLELVQEEWSIQIDAGGSELLSNGEEFYDSDALYWLSHVIYSEAGNQPLEGMIGVGNVVMNRVSDESGAFPATIEGVIFQYGQFDVARTGAIYMTPNEESVVAAKLCLEGYNTVGDSKWFVNPYIGMVSWFNQHKTYAVAIGDHAFYS